MIFDYIVIGSGPTGLLVHKELSNKHKGLVIESGKSIKTKKNDVYTKYQIKNGYKFNGLNLLFGQPPLLLSEGECVGGGSSLNSSLHHRTPSSVWEKWRNKYGLTNFEKEEIDELYQEIEKIFDLSFSKSEKPPFYKSAAKKYNVKTIPRWGKETKNGFERTTAFDVVKKFDDKLKEKILTKHKVTLIKYLDPNQIKVSGFIIDNKLVKSKHKKTFTFLTKRLFICAGASVTPIFLNQLGYKHPLLGRFQVHPSARLSLIPKKNFAFENIVEPFQIVDFFPKLMIGSSANREFLAKTNYPYRLEKNINFESVMNLYAMAPSDQRGKIFLSGFLKGFRTYNLCKRSENFLKKGLNIIYEIAKDSNEFSHIYSPAGIIDLENDEYRIVSKFIEETIQKTLSTVHIFASAPIGRNRILCPLNEDGSVPGFDNIYVMDASVIPSCPTVNPQATACIFALSLVRRYLKQ